MLQRYQIVYLLEFEHSWLCKMVEWLRIHICMRRIWAPDWTGNACCDLVRWPLNFSLPFCKMGITVVTTIEFLRGLNNAHEVHRTHSVSENSSIIITNIIIIRMITMIIFIITKAVCKEIIIFPSVFHFWKSSWLLKIMFL